MTAFVQLVTCRRSTDYSALPLCPSRYYGVYKISIEPEHRQISHFRIIKRVVYVFFIFEVFLVQTVSHICNEVCK